MPQDDGRQPGAWVPPPQHFAPPPRLPVTTPPPTGTLHGTPRKPPAARLRTLVVGGAVLALLVVAVAVVVTSGEPERPGPLFVAEPPAPPVPLFPGETGSAAPPTGSAPLATSRVRDVQPEPGTTAVTGRSPAQPSTPPVVLPVAGQELGLAPVGEPGRRIRHYNFVARLDEMGPASRDLDKADARFTVRAGRADTCLSFESFNYPGYFLRSRGTALRLDRADGSPAYDRDATFCAIPAPTGGFVLRGQSDPSRYVTATDSVLTLGRVVPAKAQAFVTRPPL